MNRSHLVWMAAALVAVGLEPLLQAQDPQKDKEPPIVIIGGTGTGGAGGAGGAGAGGGAGGGGGSGALYDGYGDIDWDGPNELPNSPLIFEPFPVNELIERFRAATAHLPGSVKREDLTYEQALFNIRGFIPGPGLELLEAMRAESQAMTAAGHLENYGVAAGMVGRLDTLLMITLARHLANPQDPTLLLNMTGLLMQRGLVNEAVAMLNRLRAGKRQPEMAFGYSPQAAIDYVDGYTSLLRGELQRAQSLLRGSFNADPSLADASWALAVAEQALGGDVRKEVIEGFLQAYGGKPFMYCGDQWALDPLTTDEEQNVGPPTDQILDLSKGTDGVLPRLVHPASGAALASMMAGLSAKQQELQAKALAHDSRASALYTGLSARLEGPNAKYSDIAASALVDLIHEANACLKPLHRMREQRDKAMEDMAEAIQRSAEVVAPRLIEIAGIRDKEQQREATRQLVSQGIAARRASINGWDNTVRINFKSWHKYATALAGQITDPEWQEYAKETILAAAATEWSSLYVGVVASYGAYLPAAQELYAPTPVEGLPPLADFQQQRCTPDAQKGSIEVDLVKVPSRVRRLPAPSIVRPDIGVSMELNCDKIAVEMDGIVGIGDDDIAHIGAGGFVEASRNRGGDITIFGGTKAVGTVAAKQNDAKGGVYVTFDSQGLKEIGAKAEGSTRTGIAKLQTFDKGFVIWAAPPRPPKFDPKYRAAIWPTVR